ncbi:MAG: type IV toxin-antitoxin system AbiEi family antitoxin [archaeon]
MKEWCEKLRLGYNKAIIYLTANKYLVRILKGTFYKLSLEERKFKKINVIHMEAIMEALKMKKINNWYFGLETAKKLNGLTHEYYATDYVINDTIFRAKPINILDRKVRFVKLKTSLFGFGITEHNGIKVSDNEKTLLDTIYLARYDGFSDEEVKNRISDMVKHCSKKKLLSYAKEYSGSMKSFVEGLS